MMSRDTESNKLGKADKTDDQWINIDPGLAQNYNTLLRTGKTRDSLHCGSGLVQ